MSGRHDATFAAIRDTRVTLFCRALLFMPAMRARAPYARRACARELYASIAMMFRRYGIISALMPLIRRHASALSVYRCRCHFVIDADDFFDADILLSIDYAGRLFRYYDAMFSLLFFYAAARCVL